MKLKLRADKEDWLIFGGFALFLLYITAITIVNLATFAETGQLSGINPFPAFSGQYIATTITLYLLVLGGIFISVGSYFFEREKGIGIVTEKKDKGYSRWAKEKEIKEELVKVGIQQPRSKAAGIPLILNKEEMWVDNGDYHSLVIGATGSGKSQAVILPLVHSLGKARESMIITDPKGEIYEKTSNMLRAKGYQVLLLNFRDPQKGNSWNPMTLPYQKYKSGDQDKAIELLDDLALNILYDESNKNADPFWEKTSADYFSGVALGLFEDAKPEEININSISLVTTVGEEKFGGSNYIKEYFDAKDPSCAAAINASATITAPSETKGSILSVFRQKVKLFASRENLSEMLSHSDINLESIGERPTVVYIVIHDEKKTYHSLVTILLKQIYETLISVAQKHGGKLPIRTNFLLDEFANMPPLKDVTTMITAARSRLIRFTMIIQNFAQLDSVYGKDDAETIRGNCGNIIYLITTELKALEEISKMCGEVKSKKDEKTASTPLVTVSDLQRMKQFEVIIMRLRKQPFKTKFTPDFQLDWGKKYPPARYPVRSKRAVHTFDIKEFVKAQKKKKLLEMMNAQDNNDGNSGGGRYRDMPPFGYDKNPFSRSYDDKDDIPDFLRPNSSNHKIDKSPLRDNPFISKNNNLSEKHDDSSNDFIKSFDDKKEKDFSKPVDKPLEKSQTDLFSSNDDNNDFDFDVDELVKKIDAKIQELEEEEKRNNELKNKKSVSSKNEENELDNKEEKTSNDIKTNDFEEKKNIEEFKIFDDIIKDSDEDDEVIVNNKNSENTKEEKKDSKSEFSSVSDIDINKLKSKYNEELKNNLDYLEEDDDDFFDDFFDN